LRSAPRGIPVVISTPATCLPLHAVDARPFALIHPPWFPADFDRLGAEYFQTQGFEVVHHGSAPLCSDYGEFHPTQASDWARRTVPDATEAVFMGGKGFRAISAIEAREETLTVQC
jgi:maleate isomerase